MAGTSIFTALTARRSAKAAALAGERPADAVVEAIVAAAAAAPDHGLLVPFRVVEISTASRGKLADAFVAALREQVADASEIDMTKAREKAVRGPLLLALIGRFQPRHPKITLSDQWLSAGAALQNMVLAAESHGLGVALRSGQSLASLALRQALALGEGEELLCFLAIGRNDKPQPERAKPAPAALFSRW
jgi:nitroreductase